MKFLIILGCLLAAARAGPCLDDAISWCDSKPTTFAGCRAVYGGVNDVKQQMLSYLTLHLNSSFDYLLMSANFGGYIKNREGMEKILRHLSDATWNDAIELIKYLSKRGINVPLDTFSISKPVKNSYEFNEIESLGYVLDSQKIIANNAMEIHEIAVKHKSYDPEVTSFLENQFLHRHADVIRNLAGLTSDLRGLNDQSNTKALSYFIFDEYLKKMM